MDENQYWIALWRTIAAAFAVLVITIGACTANRQHLVAEAIKSGVDPTAAKCAIEADQSSLPACVLKAQK